jgi:hypothetical protein
MGICKATAWTTSVACSIGMAFGSTALAATDGLDYSIGMSVEHSDNMNESPIDPIGQTAAIPRLNFDWVERGSTLQVQATGQIEYRDYLGGAFDNELRGQLAGVANWIILPERLNFDFEDYAGVQPVNLFATNAPGNQQQTNLLTLGPTLHFRFYEALKGEVDLRLSDSTASVTKEFDSQRVLGAVRAIRDINPTDQLSGNVEAENVHFSNEQGGPDFVRYTGYGRYISKLSQIDLDFALGYSSLNFSGAPDSSGVFARGKVDWRATPTSTFELAAARQYSDASQELVVDPAQLLTTVGEGRVITGSALISSQVYLEHRLDLAYAYRTERLTVRLAPYYRKLDYTIDAELNETSHGALLDASYLLRPLWSIGFDAAEETRKFSLIDRRDEDLRYGGYIANTLTTHWSWRFDLIRNQRASTQFGQGFGENIAMLSVTFKR